MRYRVSLLALSLLLAAGCKKHPLTDYRPLDQAGMSSDTVEQLKNLKNTGISDDACVKLVSMAHQRQQFFVSSNSVRSLAKAGFSEMQILELANAGQLDTLSAEAVTLHLIGLSDATVQMILHRRLGNQPTLSSSEI